MAGVSIETIENAARKLHAIANRTPVFTSRTANNLISGAVYFKCENFQRIGAFKFRGAYHALSRLNQPERENGVLTYSSGNHAQAVALAGRILKVPRTIIMPSDAPQIKRDATEAYGASIILYDRNDTTREALADKIATESGLTIIPPFDHPDVISGQGTVAKELLEETGALDVLLVCCGGGGLLSGCAVAARALSPRCEIIGVEPAQADDAARSFHSGILQSIDHPLTIADGARTSSLGFHTFPLIMQNVDDMITVTETNIVQAMKFLYERMKLVVEPTGAMATAALLAYPNRFYGKRVGIVISGGNVDLKSLGSFFGDHPPSTN